MTHHRNALSVLALVLSTVLVLALALTGCQPFPTSGPTSTPTSATTPTPTVEPTAEATPTPEGPPPTPTFGPIAAGSVEEALVQYFEALPVNDLNGGVDALAEYKSKMTPVVEGMNLDAVFGAYVAYLHDLAFGLMDANFAGLDAARTADPVKFKADLAAAGLEEIPAEGSFLIEPDFQLIMTQLTDYLTANGKQYCLLKISFDDSPVVMSFFFLNVPLTTLCDRLVEWDVFVDGLGGQVFPVADTMYKGHYRAQELQRRLRLNLLCNESLSGHPLFDSNDVLTQEFRDAYAYFIAKSPDSSTGVLIADYVAALEANAWKRNAAATAILTAAGLEYFTVEAG
jgi:hypothetical protein